MTITQKSIDIYVHILKKGNLNLNYRVIVVM